VILAADYAAYAAATSCRLRESARRPCPSPREALDLMECSALLHETLGEHQVEWFLRNKRSNGTPTAGKSRLRTRALPPVAVNIDVVLCVPRARGGSKGIRRHGRDPAVAVTGRLNEVTALEPTDGFAGAVINAAPSPSPRP